MRRLSILTMIASYLPGYKGGGPLQTIAHRVEQMGDTYDLRILTADRDIGDSASYPSVPIRTWQRVGKGEVMYLRPSDRSWRGLGDIIRATPYDLLYLNSFFSPSYTILPLLLRRVGLIPQKPVVLAPRGEFSAGAMALKRTKKRLFMQFAKGLGLYRGVTFQASSDYEAADIRRDLGSGVRVMVAPNFRTTTIASVKRRTKEAGVLRVIFLSRITRKKNLDGALRMLRGLTGRVSLDIYGPLEESAYWEECEALIANLPSNIVVSHRGALPHAEVGAAIAEHDLFLFPTHGENFGHVIFEALAVGTPVLLSDTTPWRDLEKYGVGWDLPLVQPERFTKRLQELVWMDEPEYRPWSVRAREYAMTCSKDASVMQATQRLFQQAIDSHPHGGKAI